MNTPVIIINVRGDLRLVPVNQVVSYKGRKHLVVKTGYLGNPDLFALASHFGLGSDFPAAKADCKPVRS
jgi:hypothetical protein